MNIFFLDKNPMTAAQYHCDAHITTQLKEACQILSTVHHLYPGYNYQNIKDKIYQPTYTSNRFVRWAGEHKLNYHWLAVFANELRRECLRRFNHVHRSTEILKVCMSNLPALPEECLVSISTPPLCKMPESCKVYNTCFGFVVSEWGVLVEFHKLTEQYFVDTVLSYRNFYRFDKSIHATWKYYGSAPDWFYTDSNKKR